MGTIAITGRGVLCAVSLGATIAVELSRSAHILDKIPNRGIIPKHGDTDRSMDAKTRRTVEGRGVDP